MDALADIDYKGSPPRMRGKAIRSFSDAGRFRITPAYAGKRGMGAAQRMLNQDHPRVCGEKIFNVQTGKGHKGSPPRMRGKGSKRLPKRASMGITPAYAGKSLALYDLVPGGGDHPRVCGEKASCAACALPSIGSPPRMRGKVHFGLICQHGVGITPAYAGKSQICGKQLKYEEDHPRVCGEKGYFVHKVVSVLGSPPRMRGKVRKP